MKTPGRQEEPASSAFDADVGAESRERWYAVLTQPNREAHAELHLRNQGYATYLPRRLKTARHARYVRTKHVAFFPRYLFVLLDCSRQQWRRVNSTFGVASLVMAGQEPLAVPRGVVEEFLSRSDAAGLLQPRHHFARGQRVRMMDGPLADQIGVLDRVDEIGAVRVLLEILGGPVPVRVSERSLWPIA